MFKLYCSTPCFIVLLTLVWTCAGFPPVNIGRLRHSRSRRTLERFLSAIWSALARNSQIQQHLIGLLLANAVATLSSTPMNSQLRTPSCLAYSTVSIIQWRRLF